MKKFSLSVLSLLLTSTLFCFPIFASEDNDHGDLFNQYSEEYLAEVAYLTDNIIEIAGKVLSAVGGALIILNLSYLTFDVFKTGTVWINAKW